LDFALEQATRASSVAWSVCTSQVQQALARRDLMARYDATTAPIRAELLADAEYLPAVTSLLTAAASRISLMLFLATATAGDVDHPGPAALIAALEDAADRGVMVRVILDRDDGTYRSSAINEPLVRRLRAKGIAVKLDSPDVLLHSKVVVVDGNAVVVGSHNWTLNAFEGMNELSMLITGSAVATEFTDRFDDLWANL
jgi:phosphatidylserine/phosphatidylglycerophosphate/cardiolipin synthase-like enzyme